jgi:hypothetical protein
MKRTSLGILLLSVGASGLPAPASAADLLGFYVGAAIGEAHIRTSQEIQGDTGYDYPFDEQHVGWKLALGIRPIAPVGVELEYIDFGNSSDGNANSVFGGISQADAKAVALFGLGYLPIPAPFLDVYGKLGVARARVNSTETPPIPSCPVATPACLTPFLQGFGISSSSTNVAYGIGAQAKFGSLAVRAEYERISISAGNPDMLSLGVTWTF